MLFIIIWVSLIVIGALIIVKRIAKCKKPFGMAIKTSLSGIAAMMLVNVLNTFTGVHIAVNYVTVSCAVVLGAPGTVVLLIIKLLG